MEQGFVQSRQSTSRAQCSHLLYSLLKGSKKGLVAEQGEPLSCTGILSAIAEAAWDCCTKCLNQFTYAHDQEVFGDPYT